jgi:hypothetical protein
MTSILANGGKGGGRAIEFGKFVDELRIQRVITIWVDERSTKLGDECAPVTRDATTPASEGTRLEVGESSLQQRDSLAIALSTKRLIVEREIQLLEHEVETAKTLADATLDCRDHARDVATCERVDVLSVVVQFDAKFIECELALLVAESFGDVHELPNVSDGVV